MSHYARTVIVFLQQEGITNMEQQMKFSDRNLIDYNWGKSSNVFNRMSDPQ